MSYSTIHAAFSVGDVVYYHDAKSDTVQRGKVIAIEAKCSEAGYSPKWSVFYTVAHAFAERPDNSHAVIGEDDLSDDPRRVWPAIVEPASEVAA